MSEGISQWSCPRCHSGSDEHTVEHDGPEALDVIVCRRCGAKWMPRPAPEGVGDRHASRGELRSSAAGADEE